MLTADDVLNARFTATKFTYGYDQDDVDDFLDRVVRTLRGIESGTPADDTVTAHTVRDVTFQPTRFREGYDMQQVDDLLERVRQTLDASPAAAAPTSGAPVTDAPPPPPAPTTADHVPGLVPPRPSFWRRLLGD